jgi:starvation-inducible DNA-binding protein
MANSPLKGPLKESDKEVTANVLQSTLVDLIDLSLIAKQAHWNVVGRHFRSVHLQLDELVSAARRFVDDVAERASAIGVSPNGKAKTVVENSSLPEYPESWQSTDLTVDKIVDTLGRLIQRLRMCID